MIAWVECWRLSLTCGAPPHRHFIGRWDKLELVGCSIIIAIIIIGPRARWAPGAWPPSNTRSSTPAMRRGKSLTLSLAAFSSWRRPVRLGSGAPRAGGGAVGGGGVGGAIAGGAAGAWVGGVDSCIAAGAPKAGGSGMTDQAGNERRAHKERGAGCEACTAVTAHVQASGERLGLYAFLCLLLSRLQAKATVFHNAADG